MEVVLLPLITLFGYVTILFLAVREQVHFHLLTRQVVVLKVQQDLMTSKTDQVWVMVGRLKVKVIIMLVVFPL